MRMRGAVVGVCGAVLGAWLLAGPTAVVAAGGLHSVAFPEESQPLLYSMDIAGASDPLAGCDTHFSGMSWSASGYFDHPGNSGDPSKEMCAGDAATGEGFVPVAGVSYRVEFEAADLGGAGGSVNIGIRWTNAARSEISQCTANIHPAQHSSPGTYGTTAIASCVAPAGVAYAYFIMWGHKSRVRAFDIFGEMSGGNCEGVGSGLLPWGAGAMYDRAGGGHTAWGDSYTSQEACVFDARADLAAVIPGLMVEGETVRVEFVAASNGSGSARIAVSRLIGGAVVGSPMVNEELMPAAFAPDVQTFLFDPVSDADGIAVYIGEGTVLWSLSVQNIEGSGDDEGEYPGAGGAIIPGLPDRFAECDAPSDPLDIGGWLSWLGCLVQGGFLSVVDWLQSLPGRIADALGAGLDFGSELLGGIGGAIGSVLAWAFVPSDLGASMEGLMDDAGGKVPFVWVAEVSTALEGVEDMPGGALASSMTIMGAPVAVNWSSWSEPYEQWRPALAGAVYLGFAIAAWRSIGAALGYARGGGEA